MMHVVYKQAENWQTTNYGVQYMELIVQNNNPLGQLSREKRDSSQIK